MLKKNQDAVDMTAGLNSPLTKSLIHVLAGGRLGLSLYVFLHNASAGPKGGLEGNKISFGSYTCMLV